MYVKIEDSTHEEEEDNMSDHELTRLSLSGSRARKKYSVTSLVSFSVTTDTEISPASSRRSSFITSSPDSSSEPPWSWVVLAGSFLCLSVLDGISYTFGMLLGPLMEALECGRSSVSAAGSLQVAVYSITGVLAARLVTRYGARAVCVAGALVSASGLVLASYSTSLASLLLTYSLLTGLGFGLMYIPAVVAVAEHFHKRQSLAMGICVCGTGVGTFLLAPAELYFLNRFGWRWTLVAMAGLCLLCLGSGAVMRPPAPAQRRLASAPRRKSTVVSLHGGTVVDDLSLTPPSSGSSSSSLARSLLSLLLSPDLRDSPALSSYLLVALGDGLATLALFIPFTFLPDLAVSKGVEPSNAAFLISAAGVVLLAALPALGLSWVSTYSAHLALVCMFGLLTGIWIAATSPLLVRILGLPLLPSAFGFMTAIQGTAALLGPPLAGALVDEADSLSASLQATGSLLLLASMVFIIASFQNHRREKRSGYEDI